MFLITAGVRLTKVGTSEDDIAKIAQVFRDYFAVEWDVCNFKTRKLTRALFVSNTGLAFAISDVLQNTDKILLGSDENPRYLGLQNIFIKANELNAASIILGINALDSDLKKNERKIKLLEEFENKGLEFGVKVIDLLSLSQYNQKSLKAEIS